MKYWFGVLLSLTAFSSHAQHELLSSALQDFAYGRFYKHEPVAIVWNMEGVLQADLNDGINYLLEDRPDLAEVSLTTVLKKDSLLWQAYYYRAAARVKLNDHYDALSDLNRTVKLNPDLYEGYIEQAKVLFLVGQLSESERAIKKAIQVDKKKPVAYYLRGDIALVQNQSILASKSFRNCLAVDSLFHDARIKLALMDFLSSKDETKAINHLSQVLAYDSMQPSALLFRSIFLAKKNQTQSIQDLSNLIRVSPGDMMARFLRGELLAQLQEYDRAFSDFRHVIQSTAANDNYFQGKQTWIDKKIDLQNVGAYVIRRVYGLPDEDATKLRRAYCQIILREFDKSILAIDETSTPHTEPLAVYLKAVAHEHKGEHVKALQLYDRAISLDDEIFDAYKKRGIYRQEMKEWENSIEDFNAVLRLDPETFFTYRLRGVSYYYINQFKKAISDYNTYLKYDSTNKEIIGYRGIAYLQDGQRLNAYIDFALSNNKNGFDLKDMIYLTDSVMAIGDTVTALNALNHFTAAAPYFTEAFVRKFRIYLAMNDWKVIENEIGMAVRNSRVDVPNDQYAFLLTIQAMVYAKNRHELDAIKIFTEAIKLDKSNALAYLERGKLWLSQGKVSKAQSDIQQASLLGSKQADDILSSGFDPK